MARRQVFRPAFGNRPETIVGRDDVIQALVDGLRAAPGTRERATLMVGQRGMGKTALLLDLEDRAADEGFVVARVSAGPTMLEEIVELIQLNGSRYVPAERPKVTGVSVGAMGFSAGLTFSDEARESFGFRVKLGLLCERLEEVGRGVLVLVDEVQAASDELRTLATTYQHLVGDGRNVAVVMAGLPTSVSRVLNDKVLTFLNRARKVTLEPLALSSIRSYYAQTFRSRGHAWDDGVLDDAVSMTQGFPYLMQLLGYYLVEGADEGEAITRAELDDAMASAKLDLVENVYAPVLNALSPKDRELLMAMAPDHGTSRVSDLRERLHVTDGQLQPYRSRLIAANVVSSPRRGELEFTIPVFGEYLSTLGDAGE